MNRPSDTLVEAVRKYALANYERDGWDFVVECWDSAEIRRAIGDARTAKLAILNVLQTVRCLDERRREVQNA